MAAPIARAAAVQLDVAGGFMFKGNGHKAVGRAGYWVMCFFANVVMWWPPVIGCDGSSHRVRLRITTPGGALLPRGRRPACLR